MMVSLDLIEPGTRLRGASPETVEALKQSIAEVGLLNPITVFQRNVIRGGIFVPGWALIAGLHRFEACRQLGWIEMPAHAVELGELERQIAECDENLCGPRLSPAERALFTRCRKHAYEALHPETRHGGDRKSSGQVGHSNSFTADTATRTGQAERTVRRDATRGSQVDQAILEQVRGSNLDTGTTLDALAAVPKDQQAATLERLRAGRKDRTTETEEEWQTSILRVWRRAPVEWQTAFITSVQRSVVTT